MRGHKLGISLSNTEREIPSEWCSVLLLFALFLFMLTCKRRESARMQHASALYVVCMQMKKLFINVDLYSWGLSHSGASVCASCMLCVCYACATSACAIERIDGIATYIVKY